ncbi:MAG: 1-deoxy-D-xylulose-5-phosphate reductoisomerase [Candidimonas sp.]|nr:MAG: 1-deoxy-D-xylulose-5-phosphate reductoisomerase [Candidimonas sp.]
MIMQNICILGSTGSIGENTLDVIARHRDRFAVQTLSAYSRIERLAQQAAVCAARAVVVPDVAARERFTRAWTGHGGLPEIRVGKQALVDSAADPQVTTVMAAIVGAAGLPPTLAAARAGKRVLLANKEALVAAGNLFMTCVRDSGAALLPIDSEHNAIFQCLPRSADARARSERPDGVRRLLLTASGGPFRTTDVSLLADVTPDQACAHPNWRMGRKISVDSATMLNKGLEVIEAHWLFAMPVADIHVVVHPQSRVHSMVEYRDGSILAQLGQPDMRIPIAYGLGFPDRIDSGVDLLSLAALGHLDFEEPDFARFPCLKLSFGAVRAGQAACVTLNAANEVAVANFLGRRIRYTEIARVIERSLERQAGRPSCVFNCLDDVLALDRETRTFASELCLAL